MAGLEVEVLEVVRAPKVRELELFELKITKGDKTTSTEIHVRFRAIDANGSWDPDVKEVSAKITDFPDPREPDYDLATRLRTLILDAAIPTNKESKALNIAGLAVRAAGITVLKALKKV